MSRQRQAAARKAAKQAQAEKELSPEDLAAKTAKRKEGKAQQAMLRRVILSLMRRSLPQLGKLALLCVARTLLNDRMASLQVT